MRSIICLLTSFLLCAGAGSTECAFDGVTFSDRFDGGRLSGCRQTGERAFEIGVAPEDAPINPSGWYAFAVDAQAAGRIDITLVYAHGRHRYAPKFSRNGEDWSEVGGVSVANTRNRAVFALDVPQGRSFISAQPLIAAGDYDRWLTDMLARDAGVELVEIGRSGEGRPIKALRSKKRGREAVALVGRQHPPETTGAVAFFAFVARILEDDPLAERFRKRFGVLAIPMLNPDGVFHGQWRNNSRGLDINRDWGPFTQQETRAARDAIADFAGDKPGRLALFLDFHSTWNDVLYTQPDGAEGARAWFASAWRAGIAEALGSAPRRDASHNPALPTAKSWAHETYRIPAITFEIGDETPKENIESLARAAAESMMLLLLEGPPAPEGEQ
ncbi:MAG: M14 family metallopeptidase [Pseudomonadota bacterium]|nr:M14 family metallopeptidase [Pseudomonadota bacterium]